MNPARLRVVWAQLGQLKRSISLRFRLTDIFLDAYHKPIVAQIQMLNLS
jgi:hypothetical protein